MFIPLVLAHQLTLVITGTISCYLPFHNYMKSPLQVSQCEYVLKCVVIRTLPIKRITLGSTSSEQRVEYVTVMGADSDDGKTSLFKICKTQSACSVLPNIYRNNLTSEGILEVCKLVFVCLCCTVL